MTLNENFEGKNIYNSFWLRVLGGVLLVVLILFVGFKARNAAREYRYIGRGSQQNSITVSGVGKVVAVPDVAIISLGTSTEKPTVAAAQEDNNKSMNAIIAKLKSMSIDAKDIQTTNYSVYPTYNQPIAPNTQQSIRGYVVSQNLTVKIRKLDTVSNVIAAAGTLGANQIGGLNFTVDDIEKVKNEARAKAIADAKQKAKTLSKVAGIDLGSVISFTESDNGGYPRPYYDNGLNMGLAYAETKSAPTIEAGSNEIVINASITYEVR